MILPTITSVTTPPVPTRCVIPPEGNENRASVRLNSGKPVCALCRWCGVCVGGCEVRVRLYSVMYHLLCLDSLFQSHQMG